MRRANRLLLVVVLAATACTPEIVPGAYLCGPEGACPDGQACDGPTNICVLATAVQPFACGELTETEPNDGLATAQPVLAGNLACVSRVAEVIGCSLDPDGEDWFAVEPPAVCTAVAVEARISFPIAFEALALVLLDDAGATVATAASCSQEDPDDGDDQLCLDAAVTPGRAYALRVTRSGALDCDGACSYNRYTLTVQLTTP